MKVTDVASFTVEVGERSGTMPAGKLQVQFGFAMLACSMLIVISAPSLVPQEHAVVRALQAACSDSTCGSRDGLRTP